MKKVCDTYVLCRAAAVAQFCIICIATARKPLFKEGGRFTGQTVVYTEDESIMYPTIFLSIKFRFQHQNVTVIQIIITALS